MNEMIERVARRFIAGEDLAVTDDIRHLVSLVVREIRHRGGQATILPAEEGKIIARKFVLDHDHSIPIQIRLYEGSYYPGKVLVRADFGTGKPIPVNGRQPFDARMIVDAIADAFMSLVNYKEASSKTVASSAYGWIITHDFLKGRTAKVVGPSGISLALLASLNRGEGEKFQLYDDDRILYYEGRIVGDYSGFEPLDDYGEPNAGCTGVKMHGRFL